MFKKLFTIIEKRKKELPQNSYTVSLFRLGKQKMWDKIIEESKEVLNASKREGKQRVIEESADLLYHLFVLLSAENISLREIEKELKKRNN